jgi:hypothetical protein
MIDPDAQLLADWRIRICSADFGCLPYTEYRFFDDDTVEWTNAVGRVEIAPYIVRADGSIFFSLGEGILTSDYEMTILGGLDLSTGDEARGTVTDIFDALNLEGFRVP